MSIRIGFDSVSNKVIAAPIAPWRSISPKVAAGILGVTTQTLANWRFRSLPSAARTGASYGRRGYYRLADLAEWIAQKHGVRSSAEALSRKWLEARGTVVGDTMKVIERLDRLGCTPHLERLPIRQHPSEVAVLSD
jgi:hypothetical protein